MKSIKINKSLTILCCVILAGTASFFFISGQSGNEADSNKIEALSFANSIPTPEYVEFCGKKIVLDRYDLRERFDREMNAFVYGHSTTMLLFKRANRYFPIIEPILKENGLPDDFKYLAVIESSLNPKAISVAKAVGFWQFMPETGKKYGLEVSDQVDERYHIEKSTAAACQYLKEGYKQYGDWSLSAAAYNGGFFRISSELKNQIVDSFFDLLLVDETSRYIFRILAAKELFKDPYKYGFVLKAKDLYPSIRTKKIEISSDIPNLAEFAKENKINYYLLKEFNPWLRDRELKISTKNPKSYQIDIPVIDDLYYSKNKIKVHNKNWVTD